MKFIDILKNKAVWAGVLGGLAALSVIINKPALGAFVSDPAFADTLTTAFSAVAGLVAAFLAPPAKSE